MVQACLGVGSAAVANATALIDILEAIARGGMGSGCAFTSVGDSEAVKPGQPERRSRWLIS